MSRCLLFLSLLLALPAGASAKSLPLDHFTRHDDVEAVAIAPDGRSLAVLMNTRDQSRIAYLRLSDLGDRMTVNAAEGAVIGTFAWASPARLVFTERALEQRSAEPPASALFAITDGPDSSISLKSYSFRDDTPRRTADLVSATAVTERHVLLRERAWKAYGSGYRYDADALPILSSLDLGSGNKVVVTQLPLRDAHALLDDGRQPRLASGYDEHGRPAAAWRPDGEWTALRLPGFRADSIVPRYYSPSRRVVIFTGVSEQGSLSGLYEHDLASGQTSKLYEHPEVDIADVVYDLDGSTVIGVRVDADRPEYHWLDPNQSTAKLYQLLARAFPQHDVRITSATADRQRVTAYVHSDVDPGAYYVVDVATRKADLLFSRRAWVDPATMRSMEGVRLQARDGAVLRGYLTRPNDAAGAHPLIVMPHDGPHDRRDAWSYDWVVQLLANQGYAVLQVNYRGSPGYGVGFRAAGEREWGGKMQDDLTDATRWAIEKGYAAADNICIYGAGYGGYAALMGAVLEPALYECAASYAGITDLELLFERDRESQSLADHAALAQSLGTDRGVLRARSPAYNAERIQVPVLLVHADDDPIRSYAHATYMSDALLRAGKSVRLETLGHGDHELYERTHRNEAYAKLLDFFGRYLDRP